MVQKISRFTARHTGLLCLAILGLCLLGLLPPFSPPKAARADETVSKWKTVALSDVALNLRMMALEKLKAEGSESAVNALAAIAREGDLPLRTAACAQLGRVHSSSSKAKLKGLLEDGEVRSEIRMAATACIAEHWRDRGDISYLESKCEGNGDLSAHLAVVKSRIYER